MNDRENLWQWLIAAKAYLNKHGQFARAPSSCYFAEGEHRLKEIYEENFSINVASLVETLHLPEWELFIEEFSRLPVVAARLNKIVDYGRVASTFRPLDIADQFLKLIIGSSSLIDPSRITFDRLFSDLVASLTATHTTVVDSIYFIGLRLPNEDTKLQVAPGLTLELVNADELLAALQSEAKLTSTGMMVFYGGKGSCLRACRSIDLPIYVHDKIDADSARPPTEYAETELAFECFFKAVALVSPGHLRRILQSTQRIGPFVSGQISLGQLPVDMQEPVEAHQLNAAESDAIKAYFTIVLTMTKNKSEFLLPLDYLLSSTRQRENVGKIIDLAIAAESMLVDSDREVSYRFALRGSRLICDAESERLNAFYILKSAYEARSKIVHGASAASKFRVRDGEPKVPLEDLVSEFEVLVRNVFLKLANVDLDKKPSAERWVKFDLGLESF